MTKQYTKEQTAEAIKTLRKMLKPGKTIYAMTRHASQSGMYRSISLFIVGKDQRILDIDFWAVRALEMRIDKHFGIATSGCGMDMHFYLIYELGRVLYPKGFKLAKGQYGRNGDTSGYETDGGYAFRKESL